jgi:glucose-1-phosphatase
VLICFDLGGVLVRICRSWPEGCRAAGVPEREHHPRPDHQVRRTELITRYQTGRVECDDFFRELSGLFDGVWSPAEVAKVHHAWILEPYAGTAALIEEIRAAGFPTACLSNTSHSHWGPLLQIPAIAALGTQHASHLLGLHKPDAAIYQAFENAVGIPGEDVVFFDDLEDNITAARAVGWDAVKIDHASETAPQIRAALEQRGVL